MPTLVKVGDTIINLDLMTQAYLKPGSIKLYFAVATGKAGERQLDSLELFGRDAAALREHLNHNAADLLEEHIRDI